MWRKDRRPPAARGVTAFVTMAAVFTATACSDQSSGDSPRDSVGQPNPSAVFCEEQGGEYLLETGECRLADGTIRDAWEYFREEAEAGDQDS